MVELQEKLRGVVADVLQKEKLSYVIGYQAASFGVGTRPLFIRSKEDVKKLVFSPLCSANLVRYLKYRKPEQSVGVIVKGCDSRAVVQLLQESGVDRDKVKLIGVSCAGVAEAEKVQNMLPEGSSFELVGYDDKKLDFVVDNKKISVNRSEVSAERCSCCEYKTPVIYDVLVGEKLEAARKNTYSEVKDFEKHSLEERWEFWAAEFEKCIRCYACRNACPLCYCPQCMAELLEPQWLLRSVDGAECGAWNIMRAMHLAGRCIGCGECERACPVDIPLMLLNKKLEKSCLSRFDHKAGLDPKGKPVLAAFNPNDPEEFVMSGEC